MIATRPQEALSEAFEHERRGELGSAFRLSFRASRSGHDDTDVAARMNCERLRMKIRRKTREFLVPPTPIHVNDRTPDTYPRDHASRDAMSPVLSLTTIAQRLPNLPRVLSGILEQSLQPHSVNLYVSRSPFLIDPGIRTSDDAIQEIAALGVNIYDVPNTGPYRKILPCVTQLIACNAPSSTPIVTIDDDVQYPSDLLATLRLAAEDEDDVIVSHRGRYMKMSDGSFASYGEFGIPRSVPDLRNLPIGRNGIFYRLRHLPSSVEEFCGPVIAPTTDDLWLKMISLMRCVPVDVLEPRASFRILHDFPAVEVADQSGLFSSYNATDKNDASLQNIEAFLEDHYGVSPSKIAQELNGDAT